MPEPTAWSDDTSGHPRATGVNGNRRDEMLQRDRFAFYGAPWATSRYGAARREAKTAHLPTGTSPLTRRTFSSASGLQCWKDVVLS